MPGGACDGPSRPGQRVEKKLYEEDEGEQQRRDDEAAGMDVDEGAGATEGWAAGAAETEDAATAVDAPCCSHCWPPPLCMAANSGGGSAEVAC